MNLSGKDNTINCNLEDYCPDYFKIKSDPSVDYYALQPNITLIYEEFFNKEIYIIKMNENGKIIKTDFSEDNYNFIISNNSILGNLAINEKYYFKININNNKTFANCSLPKIKAKETFDISCTIINDGFSFLSGTFQTARVYTVFLYHCVGLFLKNQVHLGMHYLLLLLQAPQSSW